MTQIQWDYFTSFKKDFNSICKKWSTEYSSLLLSLQKESADIDNVPSYPIENTIVYNTALDKITKDTEIKIILIGDNPGKNEQLQKNQMYLVGQSGKIAEGFFSKNPDLEINFRKNVIILNKTPIHTAKTKELVYLSKKNEKVKELIISSQIYMAQQTVKLQEVMNCQLWLVGYSELTNKGIFTDYKKELLTQYAQNKSLFDKVFVFQHFSMNRFSIDLSTYRKNHTQEEKPLLQSILELGKSHKDNILVNSLS